MYRWFLILLLIACQTSDPHHLKVLRVTDGDTIVLDNGSASGLKVRLIGIDAPESRDYKGRKEEPLGKEATVVLSDLIDGRGVRLEYDLESLDKYGRTLAYVYTSEGTFLNEAMLRSGYAECMRIEPNTRYAELFEEAERQARTLHLGIWQ